MNDMKFRVRDAQHSRRIQDALFKLGVKWQGVHAEVAYTDKPFLYAEFGSYSHLYPDRNYLTYGAVVDTFDRQTNCVETLLLDDGTFIPTAEYVEPTAPVAATPRLRPRKEVEQARLVEILEAMVWAAKQGVVIPDEWDDEYDQLRESLNDAYDPQELQHISLTPYLRSSH
jgi:hypothetical protein